MIDPEDILASHGDDDPARFIAMADHFLQLDDRETAAAALDRAYGIAPLTPGLAAHRAGILDALSFEEHGLRWRFIPAGTFLMGSTTGDIDERPVHPRRTDAYWITDTPLSWGAVTTLHGDLPPEPDRNRAFWIGQRNKIRRQYVRAQADVAILPMIAAVPDDARLACAPIITDTIGYGLPTEAQWEKAARGGLVGARYSWGDDPPTRERADFERMGDFRLLDPRSVPANGYGVYAMCGCVSEWTLDHYDALAYHRAASGDLSPAPAHEEAAAVLRGGSWTDCADAITVSFRTVRDDDRAPSPTIGLRLVRYRR